MTKNFLDICKLAVFISIKLFSLNGYNLLGYKLVGTKLNWRTLKYNMYLIWDKLDLVILIIFCKLLNMYGYELLDISFIKLDLITLLLFFFASSLVGI